MAALPCPQTTSPLLLLLSHRHSSKTTDAPLSTFMLVQVFLLKQDVQTVAELDCPLTRSPQLLLLLHLQFCMTTDALLSTITLLPWLPLTLHASRVAVLPHIMTTPLPWLFFT